jgi:hypothetical protein
MNNSVVPLIVNCNPQGYDFYVHLPESKGAFLYLTSSGYYQIIPIPTELLQLFNVNEMQLR